MNNIRQLGTPRQTGSDLPLVSVVIPCFNQAHFLGYAIESALGQDHPNIEVMLVDDGSTDNTSEVAERYAGVTLIRQANQGLSAARNTGLHRSQGEYLVFLDADDRLLPHALTTGLKYMETTPKCAFAAGGLRIIEKDGTSRSKVQIPPTEVEDHYRMFLTGNHIWTPAAAIFHRSPLTAIGGFDESLSAAADYDVYLTLSRCHQVTCHNTVVAEYRKHPQSMSRDAARMLETAIIVLQRQLPYIQGSSSYQRAYDEGLNHWSEVYGPLLTKQIKKSLQTRGHAVQALRKTITLIRYAPSWLGRYLIEKFQKLPVPK